MADAKFAQYRERVCKFRIIGWALVFAVSSVGGWICISRSAASAAFIVGATWALSGANLFKALAADDARRKYG